jgi:hypothetical protein
MNPLEWSEQTWAAIGVAVAVILAALGGVSVWLRHRRQATPNLQFYPLQLLGPHDSPRPRYPYALGFRVVNIGPGVAVRPDISFVDPLDQWYSEHVTRGELFPGQHWVEAAGIRGQRQEDDPDEHEARSFYERCLAMVICWDVLGRHWVHFPGKRRRVRLWRAPWRRPEQMVVFSQQFPSRGERPRSTGMGPLRSRAPE